jgi:hypothetical protein
MRRRDAGVFMGISSRAELGLAVARQQQPRPPRPATRGAAAAAAARRARAAPPRRGRRAARRRGRLLREANSVRVVDRAAAARWPTAAAAMVPLEAARARPRPGLMCQELWGAGAPL